MEMVKENVEDELVMRAGLVIEDEFKLWFEEHREDVKNTLLNWSEEYTDLYYDLAHTVTIIAQKLFLERKGLSYDEDEEIGFGNIIHACDLFN